MNLIRKINNFKKTLESVRRDIIEFKIFNKIPQVFTFPKKVNEFGREMKKVLDRNDNDRDTIKKELKSKITEISKKDIDSNFKKNFYGKIVCLFSENIGNFYEGKMETLYDENVNEFYEKHFPVIKEKFMGEMDEVYQINRNKCNSEYINPISKSLEILKTFERLRPWIFASPISEI
jgi:hypothetical protein